jgi:hypothetical protein
MSGSQFPKKIFLVYLPNNFQVWFDVLVEHASYEYGALAAALHDESLINFDYVVSNLSFRVSVPEILRLPRVAKRNAPGKSMAPMLASW